MRFRSYSVHATFDPDREDSTVEGLLFPLEEAFSPLLALPFTELCGKKWFSLAKKVYLEATRFSLTWLTTGESHLMEPPRAVKLVSLAVRHKMPSSSSSFTCST